MAAKFQPYLNFKHTLSDGTPAVGYQVFTYEAGTTTKKASYTDINKSGTNTNPVILDANGEANIVLDGNYKIVLTNDTDTDPPASPIDTWDNVSTEEGASTAGNYNLISNSSFETDPNGDGKPDDWSIVELTGGTVAVDSTAQVQGTNSLKFTSTTAGGGTATSENFFEVIASETYNLSFQIISSSATNHNTVQIDWYDKDKVFSSTTTLYDATTGNPTSWTQYDYRTAAPAAAKYGKLKLTGVDSDSTTLASNVKFDAVVLYYNDEHFGIRTLSHKQETVHDITSDADYTLTAAQNEYGRIRITDTGVTLTTARNIIVDTSERDFIGENDTAQDLTFKTSGGSGISVPAGEWYRLRCDGTDVVEVQDPLKYQIHDNGVSATTSGTAIDITGIPAGVKRMFIDFVNVSTNGTDRVLVQLGYSGGIVSSGYVNEIAVLAASTAAVTLTDGFNTYNTAAASIRNGRMTLTLADAGNEDWVCESSIDRDGNGIGFSVGVIESLGGELDRIRLTTTSGTDTFDAGHINLKWEF